MSVGDTWSETAAAEAAETVSETPKTRASSSPLAPGRMTVLPRVEAVDGDEVQLVQDARHRFEVTERLGQGGLGEVLGARDHDIGRRVAIKRIRPDRATRGAFLRFVQEVRTVGRLDHPGIVPIHDVGRDEDGEYYFVMKYVHGQTLEDLLEGLRAADPVVHASWPFERRVSLFASLLHAVAHAHAHGVIHRDIKPENVMIGSHGQVQLLDWGVAKLLDAAEIVDEHTPDDVGSSGAVTHTRAGSLIGTPRYMSPEQAAGEPCDVRTDTWALSMLLYELLTLHHPFEDVEGVDALLDAIRTRQVGHTRFLPARPIQGHVPADLGWFAVDGLKLDPDQRYQTVQQMIDRLDRRATGVIPIQCPMTFQKVMLWRASRQLDRHPVLFTSAAIGLLFSAAAAMVATVVLAALIVRS